MFYDTDLMNSKSLGKVWRIGHGLGEVSVEEASMAKICEKLDFWVDSTHEEVHRRLSLRASSVFVDGAARLYKRKLELLFEDTQRLERDMSRRKRIRGYNHTENNISQTFTEQEFQKTTIDSAETVATYLEESESSLRDDRPNDNCKTSNESLSHDFLTANTQKVDKSVQTSPKLRRKNRSFDKNLPRQERFDENLPFGLVIVHDNYHSRVPSKIIFSSLNPDVIGNL